MKKTRIIHFIFKIVQFSSDLHEARCFFLYDAVHYIVEKVQKPKLSQGEIWFFKFRLVVDLIPILQLLNLYLDYHLLRS